MNRRSFISGLIRVGAFAAFDPHRVIFDMGRRLFLPDPREWIIYGSVYDGHYVELGRCRYGKLDLTGYSTAEQIVAAEQSPIDGIPLLLGPIRLPWPKVTYVPANPLERSALQVEPK